MCDEQYKFVLKIETDSIAATRVHCACLFDIDRLKAHECGGNAIMSIANAVEILHRTTGIVVVQTPYAVKITDTHRCQGVWPLAGRCNLCGFLQFANRVNDGFTPFGHGVSRSERNRHVGAHG
jgi:hypothetical protein